MKTIIDYNVAFGGYCYRVTANKQVAHIQEMTPRSNRYVTRVRLSRVEFDAVAEEYDLYNVYDQNPAKFASLIALYQLPYL
jgi:hypothetical protein